MYIPDQEDAKYPIESQLSALCLTIFMIVLAYSAAQLFGSK